jgi:DNA (cytosine-5)-methyltransferase 1
MSKLKQFDCFSGYGGFALAMKESGVKTVGFSEVDPYANKVLAERFPEVKNYGDIRKIKIEELPTFDILTGGFPCQDLSVAGRQQGLSGRRSGLFFEWLRILKGKNPKYFILENVKGLLSSNNGWDFATIIIGLEQAGYCVLWGLVNADIFVPQNRERVFIIGYRSDLDFRQVFPIEGKNRSFYRTGREKSYCIDANYFKGISPAGYQSKRRQLIHNGEGITFEMMVLLEKGRSQVRRLTPLECERLMGLPDGWTDVGISDTQRYKLCGNGVVPAVVVEILKRMGVNHDSRR